MKILEKKIYVCVSFIIILLLTLILGYTIFPTATKNSLKQSSLFNKKYIPTVTKIEICEKSINQTCTLSSVNGIWIGETSDGSVFPILSNKTDDFLETLSAVRFLEKSSGNPEYWDEYGLNNDEAIQIRIFGTDPQYGNDTFYILTELYFGKEYFNGKYIYCRTSKSSDVFSIKNDLYPYLSVNSSTWADMQLVSPVICGISDAIVREKTIDCNNLLSAKASEIKPLSFLLNKNFNLDRTIHIDFGDGGLLQLEFYKDDTNKDNYEPIYYVKPIYNPVKSNSQINKKTPQNLFYILEISNWTYSRLLLS